MTNIGVRAEHMSSTFSVYQKVRIHMSILSGMWESIASTSLLKRFSNRPVGVLSKKVCGARRTPWSMLPCMNLAARSILWARHSRQLTNNSAPAGREEVQVWRHKKKKITCATQTRRLSSLSLLSAKITIIKNKNIWDIWYIFFKILKKTTYRTINSSV